MKKLIFAVLVLLSVNSHAGALPKKWHGYVSGIKVSESDLGTYTGKSNYEGADFFFFKKEISTNDDQAQVCYYAVLAKPPYYIADGLSGCDSK